MIQSVTRRRFVRNAGAAALAAPYIFSSSSAMAQSKQVTFVTWGGNYRDAIVDGALKPFTRETGIKVNVIDTPDMAKIKAQVTTGNVEWDIFDAPGAMAATGSKQGYWEDLPGDIFDHDDLTVAPTHDLAPFYSWAGGFVWNPQRYPQKDANPLLFADFFNREKYPGRRAFRDRPLETFEMALVADGVAPSDLYPLDVDRAFAVMDKIKPDVVSWVNATPQTVTLLQTNEVDFSYTYTTRARGAIRNGNPFKFSMDQLVCGLTYLTVLKNSPRKEQAFRLIAYMLKPEIQAAVMVNTVDAPLSRKGMSLLPEEVKSWMPDVGDPKHVIINDMWWSENYDEVTRRFKEWMMV